MKHSEPTNAGSPDRSPVLCAAALICPNTCLDLTISCGSCHFFTLYSNRLSVFTSVAIILPFIAAKRTTSIGSYKSKPIKEQPNICSIERTPDLYFFLYVCSFGNIHLFVSTGCNLHFELVDAAASDTQHLLNLRGN